MKYRLLSEENRERIHQESLRILAEVKVRFHSKVALRHLELVGARIDYPNLIARIDQNLIDQALKTAPKEFTLGARNWDNNFALPSPYTAYTLDGTASFALDFESGQLLVLEQIIVDEEIARRCRRLAAGIDYSESKNLFDDLLKVGPGGHFLDIESTFHLCRGAEFYQPQLHDKHKLEEIQESCETYIYAMAREKVTEILSAPVQNTLSDTVKAKLDDILNRATDELAKD